MWTTLATQAARRAAATSNTTVARRTFLSAAYGCTDAWNARLQQPILQRIKPDAFYYELDGKFQQNGKCSAIDIDLFANRLTDAALTDELADLLHKLRQTEETTATLESTGHAVCRLYLEQSDDIHELLAILDDRISYGVFLDSFTANLALEKLIRQRAFTPAARVATFLMLQEDFDNEISAALSLYACVKHLQAPATFDRPTADDAGADDPAAVAAAAAAAEAAAKTAGKGPAAKKKKVEEVRVRVKFLRNEFFDGHFDLREPGQLVGKTVAMIGRRLANGDNSSAAAKVLGNSAQLLGLWHLQAFKEAGDFVSKLLKSADAKVHSDVVKGVLAELEAVAEPSEEQKSFGEQLRQLAAAEGHLEAGDFEMDVCAFANEVVQRTEPLDIAAQSKVSLMIVVCEVY